MDIAIHPVIQFQSRDTVPPCASTCQDQIILLPLLWPVWFSRNSIISTVLPTSKANSWAILCKVLVLSLEPADRSSNNSILWTTTERRISKGSPKMTQERFGGFSTLPPYQTGREHGCRSFDGGFSPPLPLRCFRPRIHRNGLLSALMTIYQRPNL